MASLHLAKEIFNLIYPIGSIYKSTDNISPETLFGGTWKCIYNTYDIKYLGSQCIWINEWHNENGPVKRTPVIGAYRTALLDGIFGTPEEYEKYKLMSDYTIKVGMTAEITTGGTNKIKLYLNSCLMCEDSTFSYPTYRELSPMIQLYSLSEIGQEKVYNYSSPGINLYIENTGSPYGYVNRPTVHGYLVSNKKHYIWERIE